MSLFFIQSQINYLLLHTKLVSRLELCKTPKLLHLYSLFVYSHTFARTFLKYLTSEVRITIIGSPPSLSKIYIVSTVTRLLNKYNFAGQTLNLFVTFDTVTEFRLYFLIYTTGYRSQIMDVTRLKLANILSENEIGFSSLSKSRG